MVFYGWFAEYDGYGGYGGGGYEDYYGRAPGGGPIRAVPGIIIHFFCDENRLFYKFDFYQILMIFFYEHRWSTS